MFLPRETSDEPTYCRAIAEALQAGIRPVRIHAAFQYGSLCAAHQDPDEPFTEGQLKLLAKHAATALGL